MEEIKDFILNNSYFQLDDENEEYVYFATREHGVIGLEYDSAGDQDIEEARKICKLVNSKFPKVIATWDTCDEWTNLYVDLRKR